MFILNSYRYRVPFVNAKSLSFDGTNESVSMGNNLDFERNNAFSLSSWVRFDSLGNARTIVSKQDNNSPNKGYLLFKRSADNIDFYLVNDIASNRIIVRTNTTVSINTWYNIVVTYNGTSNASGVTFYINGSSVAVTIAQDNLTSSISNTNDFHIGSRDGAGVYMDGFIDEVSVWNKELSSGEVTEIYNSGTPSDLINHSAYSNLVSWWQMGDDDTISSITDRKGSNNGTPQNMDSSNITTTIP